MRATAPRARARVRVRRCQAQRHGEHGGRPAERGGPPAEQRVLIPAHLQRVRDQETKQRRHFSSSSLDSSSKEGGAGLFSGRRGGSGLAALANRSAVLPRRRSWTAKEEEEKEREVPRDKLRLPAASGRCGRGQPAPTAGRARRAWGLQLSLGLGLLSFVRGTSSPQTSVKRSSDYSEGVKHCSRLPGEVVDAPSLETFKAPPKPIPKTIENQRVYDETTVDPNDEEVAFDEATDEFAPYFNRQTVPKILITTSDRPRGRTVRFCEQLATVIPNSHVYYRRGLALKRIIPQCIARDFTDLIVINEDRKIPNGLVLSHLPDGPTAHFRMSSVRLRKEIKRKGKEPTEHVPEVILNNFTTRLGHSLGRMFASLFPHDPQFIGRQVATFHNQRDYIFFRFHRYIFKSEKKVGIQELGPRFTLKLRSLQKGTFDSKFGEYEWIHKRREMDTSRRKFHL
ncbi:ribosome production factor 1 [Manacus vitellinus]|uniref:ribosome production factor 1 n=1 Tax=Manacus vitellinus TaxID=328815 RepID=UPI00115CA04A|nr:ribosome production factor 1 [Manacus vitellinus]